ncbi:hypothetical protein HGB24_01610 [Candidatus Saccharibacteria bacterium]|nr:hypothetical protein [Candidatus Saccharibacteria bacterium]
MGLFVKQEENRTELQQRIAKDLQDRVAERAKKPDLPDGVDDSQYIQGTKRTTSLAWLWILIIVVAIGLSIWLMSLRLAKG